MADNKKLRQKTSDTKKANDLQKELLGKQQKELQRQSNLQEIQTKIQESRFTAQKLRAVGDVKNAKLIEDSLNSVQALLGKNKNSNSVAARLEELVEIEKSANSAAKINAAAFERRTKELEDKKNKAEKAEQLALEKKKQDDENFEKLKESLKEEEEKLGLKGLTDKIKDQTETLKSQTTLGKRELGTRLTKLSLGSMSEEEKENALILKDAFKEAQSNLQKALESGDHEKIKLARKQVENLEDSVQSEEDRREQSQKQRDSNSTLIKIKEGVEGFNSKLADMASGGGFVAGLAAIALAVFSPETLSAVVRKFINWFTAIVDALEALINGDMESFKKTFNDNLALFASLAGLLVLYFGPQLLGLLANVANTVRTVRTFMMVTALPAISSFFTGMMTSVSAMLVPMLPAIAIGAGIIAVLGVLLIAFNKLKESLGPGASIVDTLKVAGLFLLDFLAMLVNGITFIPRKLIDLLGPTVAKFIMGDDFDTSAIEAIGEGFDTGRGKREIARQRAENEARVKQEEEEARLQAERQSKIDSGELPGDMLDLLGKENADVIADLRAQGIQLPSTAAMSQSTINSSSSQSTTIITERPSRSASVLSVYSTSSFR